MILEYHSTDKYKECGHSGSKIFGHDYANLYISHVRIAGDKAKALIISFEICEAKISIEYMLYDDHEDYKTIMELIQVVRATHGVKDVISRKIIRLVMKAIQKNKQFNIISFADKVYDAGLKEGRKQKAGEIRKSLYEDEY